MHLYAPGQLLALRAKSVYEAREEPDTTASRGDYSRQGIGEFESSELASRWTSAIS